MAFVVVSGADLNWIGHDHKTPYDVAQESKDDDLLRWLHTHGARRATERS